MIYPRSRLVWLCRRGTRELDLLLRCYLDKFYDNAPDADRKAFEALLGMTDPELHSLFFEPPRAVDLPLNPLVEHIREIAASEA